ncbi:prepilin peptidase [Protofrankia symbiont of Coriaria ruscifolia]|uniref:prepilin peptidase n=1 Tax=Protofrankia symbiont of Coriaria ruscifolia TaxID=1306542 RepID=UPI0010412E22|nr:A24 family peptidase [Protofrankia symbiont of Coriaria ruscifolia]
MSVLPAVSASVLQAIPATSVTSVTSVTPSGSVVSIVLAVAIVLAALCVVPGLTHMVGAFGPVEGEQPRRPVPTRDTLGLLTATVVVAFAAKLTDHVAWLPAYAYLGLVGVALAAIDVRVHRLPDVITLPSYPVMAGLFGVAAVLDQEPGRWLRGVIAAAAVFALFAAIWALPGAGLGFGDVRLSGLLGGALGWLGVPVLLTGLMAGITLAGIWVLILLVTRRAGRRTQIAYGPFLLMGAFVGVLAWNAH